MRPILALSVLALIPAVACQNPQRAEMTFVNTSDVVLCFHPSSEADLGVGTARPEDLTALGKTSDEIKPGEISKRDTGCGYGGSARNHSVTVRLTAGSTEHAIYEKTAACFEWQDAHATFIIKQRGDQLSVNDSLPAETPRA
jgi:hypothetical protein